MKFGSAEGRAVLVIDDAIADVALVSKGMFGPDPMSLYSQWDAFVEFARTVSSGARPLRGANLCNPIPRPSQVFAIGLNYRDHAEESKMALPEVPAVFTKFPASLCGPFDQIEIADHAIDWEAELVAVIGRRADRVDESDAWSHVAGLTIGQDISDRHLQFAAASQFSLGKSRRNFGPLGPWVVTLDEINTPDDLSLGCRLNGETMQDARTCDLIFSIPQLVAELSNILPLEPGDIIFTGTPSGIGATRTPPRFLAAGDVLETWVEDIGVIRNTFVAPVP